MERFAPISSPSKAAGSIRELATSSTVHHSNGRRFPLCGAPNGHSYLKVILLLTLAGWLSPERLVCCRWVGEVSSEQDRKSASNNSLEDTSGDNQTNYNAYPAAVEGYKIRFSEVGENYVTGEAGRSPAPPPEAEENVTLRVELELELAAAEQNQSRGQLDEQARLIELELSLDPNEASHLDAGQAPKPAARRKRALWGARPKITRRILKKVTPTKVIIGAHLGTMAYRKIANWTGGPPAGANVSLALANSTSPANLNLNATVGLNGTASVNGTAGSKVGPVLFALPVGNLTTTTTKPARNGSEATTAAAVDNLDKDSGEPRAPEEPAEGAAGGEDEPELES